MDHPAVIAEFAITPDERLPAHDLTEYLYAEDVAYDVLSLPIDIGMDEGDVIVTRDDVPQCRQAFLDALYHDGIGEGIAQVRELDVGGGIRDEQSATIARGRPADETTAGDGRVYYRYVRTQFGFEYGIEILRSVDTG